MNILLVDDTKNVLESVSHFLMQHGCTVDTAINGLSAFELTHKKEYDLFIIDHLMPLMDGIKLIKNLKQHALTKNVPIIFMSTQDLKVVRKLPGLEAVEHIIAKPIDYSQLSNIFSLYQMENSLTHTL